MVGKKENDCGYNNFFISFYEILLNQNKPTALDQDNTK